MTTNDPPRPARVADDKRGGKADSNAPNGLGATSPAGDSDGVAPHPEGNFAPGTPSADRQPDESSPFPTVRVFLVILTWSLVMWGAIGLSVHDLVPGGWWTLLAAAVVSALPSLVFLHFVGSSRRPPVFLRLGVFRPFWYIQLGLPLVALASLSGTIAGFLFGAASTIGHWATVGAAVGYGVFIAAGFFGSRRLVVRHLEPAFPDWPASLDGLRIVQISDLHVGAHTPKRFTRRISEAVAAARPDLIVVTGDQVDDFAEDVEVFAERFGGLSAPLGVYAIPGNHDVYAGWTAVRRGLEQMGMKVLVNEAVRIVRDDAAFWLVGTGDPAGTQWTRHGGAAAAPDIVRSLAGVSDGGFVIALAHNPALWPRLAERGVQLTLSGHTHHGQVSIPVLKWSLASPFLDLDMGLYRRGGSILYINPGTNYWGVPLRVGAFPEVTVVTMRTET